MLPSTYCYHVINFRCIPETPYWRHVSEILNILLSKKYLLHFVARFCPKISDFSLSEYSLPATSRTIFEFSRFGSVTMAWLHTFRKITKIFSTFLGLLLYQVQLFEMLVCAKWSSFEMRPQVISFENLLDVAAFVVVVVVVAAATAAVVVFVVVDIRSSESTKLCSPLVTPCPRYLSWIFFIAISVH